jgi:cytochrome c oxidase cbb3-type subunit II
MKMNPVMVIIGSLIVFWASLSIAVILPTVTMHIKPSEIWIPMDENAKKGHNLYVRNGCSYCHSMYIRTNDWGTGADRIAQAGDYEGQEPAILGTERTGPDLSQEGGQHPYDWHVSHFVNPRNTSPYSLMPNWEFLGNLNIDYLISYVQYLGWKDAKVRIDRQNYWKLKAIKAYKSGPDSNIAWLHSNIPAGWLPLPNPYPADSASILRGKRMYQQFCMGCHGTIGDGDGLGAPFIYPTPLNFTTLRRNLVKGKYVGGIIYYQVMNGITGTAMPFFKKQLQSAWIWDLANYVSVSFIGYTDANIPPEGIDAAYEPAWKNTYPQPVTPEGGE